MPDTAEKRAELRRRLPLYLYANETLYRRSHNQTWLRCLSNQEAEQAMREVHQGVCGGYQSGPKMALKLKGMGYYWPSLVRDCMQWAQTYHQCQIHGDFIHRHPLHPTIASWPFAAWGTDVIGPIDPPSSKGHRFILAATDDFSRWTEAVTLREVKADNVINFFERHVIFRFGIPDRIVSDNGPAFKSHKLHRFAAKYKIDWRYSSIYNARAAEAFNKTL